MSRIFGWPGQIRNRWRNTFREDKTEKRKENKSKRDSMFISVRYTTVIFCAPWERWMRRRQSIREGMTRFGWRAALVDKL